MVEGKIFREQTLEEKADYKNIFDKEKSPKVIFNRIKADNEAEYNRKRQPFCARCAKIDFEKNLSDKTESFMLTLNNEVKNKIKIDPFSVDFTQYAESERFAFGKLIQGKFDNAIIRKPATKKAVVNGVSTEAQYGWVYNLTCKQRGCGNAMEIDYKDEEKFLKYMKVNKEQTDKYLNENPIYQKKLDEIKRDEEMKLLRQSNMPK